MIRRLGWIPVLLALLLLAAGWTTPPQEGGTTEDPSDVVVTQLHIFITDLGAGRLQVGEYYLVSNMGEETYVGAEDPESGERVTLLFTLPEGAEGLRFDGLGIGERFVALEGGFADTEPVPPGTATVETLFSYELPYREGLQVERVLDVPIASVVLVVSGGEMGAEGPGLVSGGAMETQMGPALSYTAGPLAAGEPFVFTLVEQPDQGMPSSLPGGTMTSTRDSGLEIGIGLVALVVAGGVVYFLWRPPAPGPLPAQARPLVSSIAALDADFQAGEISERAYRKRRSGLKRQLQDLLDQETR